MNCVKNRNLKINMRLQQKNCEEGWLEKKAENRTSMHKKGRG